MLGLAWGIIEFDRLVGKQIKYDPQHLLPAGFYFPCHAGKNAQHGRGNILACGIIVYFRVADVCDQGGVWGAGHLGWCS